MKKFITTLTCTLVLSLAGTFGLSQNLTGMQKVEAASVNTTTNCNTQNSKALVYKNINLSKCKTVNDVVKTLQKNGYRNITKKNIKNIKSLKGILAAVQAKKSTSNQTTATLIPTKAPVATTKPVITATPAPTKAPVVTTKPVVTATPSPTKTPTATPTPTVKPSTTTNTSGIGSYASEVLRLVNIERAKAGLSAYTTNQTLSAAANKRAQETSVSFSHTRPDGSKFSSVFKEFGILYRAAGENIAYGQKTPQEVVTGWMNSTGHRANILNANFGKIGIGVYQKNGVIYWTQEFTN